MNRKLSVVEFNLFADGDPLLYGAVVADDGAAPMEATVTAFRPLLSDHVVAASAAERLAII